MRSCLEVVCVLQSSVEVAVRPGFLGGKEKFSAEGMSLEALLAYDQGDTKEWSVEVGLFAEFFQEMLDACYGRALLRCIAAIEREVALLSPPATSATLFLHPIPSLPIHFCEGMYLVCKLGSCISFACCFLIRPSSHTFPPCMALIFYTHLMQGM